MNISSKRARIARQRIAVCGAAAMCAALVLPFAGCNDGPMFCTAESVPGIAIKVVDAETGEPAACGAAAWLIAGSWSELLEDSWNCAEPESLQSPWLKGAHERSGTYTVLVLKEGYIPWSRSNVRVVQDDCHVHTVTVEARLVRRDQEAGNRQRSGIARSCGSRGRPSRSAQARGPRRLSSLPGPGGGSHA